MNRDLLTAIALSAVLITGGSSAAHAAMPQTPSPEMILAIDNEAGAAWMHVSLSTLAEPSRDRLASVTVKGDCLLADGSSDERLRRVKRPRKVEVDLTQTEWTELMVD